MKFNVTCNFVDHRKHQCKLQQGPIKDAMHNRKLIKYNPPVHGHINIITTLCALQAEVLDLRHSSRTPK